MTAVTSFLLCTHFITVFHEFCQIKKSLSDLGYFLRCEGLFETKNEFILLCFCKFSPAGHKGSIEQISENQNSLCYL